MTSFVEGSANCATEQFEQLNDAPASSVPVAPRQGSFAPIGWTRPTGRAACVARPAGEFAAKSGRSGLNFLRLLIKCAKRLGPVPEIREAFMAIQAHLSQ